MNQPHSDPVIDEIREVRRRISAQFDDDPDRLVAHYIELQEQHQDRLYRRKPADRAAAQPAA